MNSLILFESELKEMTAVVERLLSDANAKGVFLIDKDGQLITSSGDVTDIDTTSLASLTAGNIAATGGLAKLIGEKEFSILFHEGKKDNMHISIVAQRVILVVIFDENSSLGLVRLRVKKADEEMRAIMDSINEKRAQHPPTKENLLIEITDEDIENLFH